MTVECRMILISWTLMYCIYGGSAPPALMDEPPLIHLFSYNRVSWRLPGFRNQSKSPNHHFNRGWKLVAGLHGWDPLARAQYRSFQRGHDGNGVQADAIRGDVLGQKVIFADLVLGGEARRLPQRGQPDPNAVLIRGEAEETLPGPVAHFPWFQVALVLASPYHTLHHIIAKNRTQRVSTFVYTRWAETHSTHSGQAEEFTTITWLIIIQYE